MSLRFTWGKKVMKIVLVVDNISAAYGKTKVLWGVSLSVAKDEIILVAGSNGAGKSTLLNTIAGLMKPLTGMVLFDERKISGMPAYEVVTHGISLVPEGRHVFPHLSVNDNLLMGGYLIKSEESLKRSIEKVYQIFSELSKKRKEYARTLSGGQRQMLSIGIGFMSEPKLMMIDEPSSGLSPLMLQSVLETINRIRKEMNISFLIVEQNIKSALTIVDRGYILENGRFILEGSADMLKSNKLVKESYLGI